MVEDNVILGPNSALNFRRGNSEIRVTESGVDPTIGDAETRREVQDAFDAGGGWIGIWIPLEELGFELVSIELFEEMALDLLEDALTEATEASNNLQLAEECKDPGEAFAHRLKAAPHVRKAVILSAAAAEAYINEFISRALPDRVQDLDRLSPPAKWSVGVELATGKKLENELPGLTSLRELFSYRNKLMHFHPSVRIIQIKRTSKKANSISALLDEEWEIWRFPRALVDAVRALNAITESEPWDRVKDMVSRGIEEKALGYLMAWSDRVGRVLDQMDPADIDKLREEFLGDEPEDGSDH